ncbi:hypothetical protein [Salinisphaera sp.]|uniref:hypothetical protein n=1 Tax=Salinisphaera sp. TaxID=1914330 RepID=UPI002D7697D3|nr:hypothetical protein [Salinisphaera sp.]HET7313899.1 hypothetical protein [Salinisphaera sp.]
MASTACGAPAFAAKAAGAAAARARVTIRGLCIAIFLYQVLCIFQFFDGTICSGPDRAIINSAPKQLKGQLFSTHLKIKAGACPSLIFNCFAADGRGEHAVAYSRY